MPDARRLLRFRAQARVDGLQVHRWSNRAARRRSRGQVHVRFRGILWLHVRYVRTRQGCHQRLDAHMRDGADVQDEGVDLVEAMESLYERYGYYLNRTINMSYPGSSGAEKMQAIMDGLRTNPPQVIADLPVLSILDYGDGVPMTKINGNPDEHQVLPDANVISFDLGDGMRIIIRPSGTEPKIKAYVFSKANTREQAEQLLSKLSDAARELLD